MAHPRQEHCKLAVLNNNGKCIATCSYNQRNFYQMDCTGHTGKTIDLECGREVPLMRADKLEAQNNGN